MAHGIWKVKSTGGAGDYERMDDALHYMTLLQMRSIVWIPLW
jgi:hypothetical protein